ncbi:DNA polymerase IV [Sporolactobacillus pectinivorans]|uniref:DNA polymerase IV n=1 Tax=Sporolactobacillus pectinivorans TaxID=1591408 RepID=UPI000C25F0AB|nr:DNA polymerase IV [Sporolactobacillus pectinivorans]
MEETHKKPRIIFHIDMNSFYASVEIALHPEWRGKPLAIAGKPEERHGIVVTSSYEARKMGVRTTMTVQEAKKKCPQLIVKHPDFVQYRAISERLFQLLGQYTPLVEKASIDEGYLDMTDEMNGIPAAELAKDVQEQIMQHFRLPCSVGIAPNKFLAKMASNMKKPLGITILRKRELPEIMWPMPIGRMHGIGPKTEEQMKALGIATIGDLAQYDSKRIAARFGISGQRLYQHANGIDDRPVDPDAWESYKSIGHSVTLSRDSKSIAVISSTLDSLSEKLAQKIRREHVVSYELTVMIRYQNWETVTRRLSTVQPFCRKEEIKSYALNVFRKQWSGKAVRLLGITLSAFQPVGASTKQLDLFSYEQDAAKESLIKLVDQVNEKFGDGALKPAAILFEDRRIKSSENKRKK